MKIDKVAVNAAKNFKTAIMLPFCTLDLAVDYINFYKFGHCGDLLSGEKWYELITKHATNVYTDLINLDDIYGHHQDTRYNTKLDHQQPQVMVWTLGKFVSSQNILWCCNHMMSETQKLVYNITY